MHTYTICTFDMKIDEFLINVLSSEEKSFTFLRRYGLYSKNSLPTQLKEDWYTVRTWSSKLDL